MLRNLSFMLNGCLVLSAIFAYSVDKKPITESCLTCMCEALSGCNDTAICVNGACGIFRLTWDQWVDCGRLTLAGESPLSESSFINCANDPHCAADSLQNYMVKYGQDCNNDDKEDCLDYNAIHYMGPFSCRKHMPFNYEHTFKKCIKQVQREEEEKQQQQKQQQEQKQPA
ncbi:lysozyme [Drosophila nasuta]|uniref:lysozyme n=1 Tax=Drosophila nasuta TaxID=42062 RepID=UPI00295EDC70|nr:lysozyme [Drosophila nasuta]